MNWTVSKPSTVAWNQLFGLQLAQ